MKTIFPYEFKGMNNHTEKLERPSYCYKQRDV